MLLFPCYLHFLKKKLSVKKKTVSGYFGHIFFAYFPLSGIYIEIRQVFANWVQQDIVLGTQEGFKNNIIY